MFQNSTTQISSGLSTCAIVSLTGVALLCRWWRHLSGRAAGPPCAVSVGADGPATGWRMGAATPPLTGRQTEVLRSQVREIHAKSTAHEKRLNQPRFDFVFAVRKLWLWESYCTDHRTPVQQSQYSTVVSPPRASIVGVSRDWFIRTPKDLYSCVPQKPLTIPFH